MREVLVQVQGVVSHRVEDIQAHTFVHTRIYFSIMKLRDSNRVLQNMMQRRYTTNAVWYPAHQEGVAFVL